MDSSVNQARDAFPPMGIYAIRARASGHLLLGASRNVHAALNRSGVEGFDYAGELKALAP